MQATYANLKCTINLDSGVSATLFEGDFGGPSSQTISHVAALDVTPPTATFTTTNNTDWSQTPVTVGVRCVNSNTDNGDTCTCAGVESNNPLLQGNWATTPLADTNDFTRRFNVDGRYTGDLFVKDNAGNPSPTINLDIGVDATPPSVTVAKVNGKIQITATDTVSGLKATILTDTVSTTTLNNLDCAAAGSINDT